MIPSQIWRSLDAIQTEDGNTWIIQLLCHANIIWRHVHAIYKQVSSESDCRYNSIFCNLVGGPLVQIHLSIAFLNMTFVQFGYKYEAKCEKRKICQHCSVPSVQTRKMVSDSPGLLQKQKMIIICDLMVWKYWNIGHKVFIWTCLATD